MKGVDEGRGNGATQTPPAVDEWPPREFQEILDGDKDPDRIERFKANRRAQHPQASRAILADARVFAAFRAETLDGESDLAVARTALRLCWQTDAFFSLALYRVRCRLEHFRVPILPALLHKLSMATAQICIGEHVVMAPGVYVPHGQIVIDGLVDVGQHVVLAPWSGIGLEVGHYVGAKVSEGVYLGTGSKLIGPVRVHAYSQVAANSVVIHDVPERTTVAGAPARVIGIARQKVNFPPGSRG
jgi:serine O-acetyltransferase